MAKYPATKALRKAVPLVRLEDNVVKSWEIEVVLTHTREDGSTWSKTFSHTEENLEYLNKEPSDFTASELIGFLSSNVDVVFDAHYEAHNTPPTEERISSFNLNDLAS